MTQTPPTRAIFINYRRDDTGGEAGRLYDDLTRAFDANTVFMDVAGIQPGKDFRKSIDENVAQSAVLLAVIGRQWLTISDASGARRLDNPNDFVRLEIASALAGNIPVIPVLVQNAAMPSALALPEPLQDLAYRNGVELTLPRWTSDVALLVAALKSYVHPATPAPLVHNTIPVGLPPPSPPPRPRAKPSLNLIFGPIAAGIIIAALILIGLVVALYEYGKNLPPDASSPQAQVQPTTQYQVPLSFNSTRIYPIGTSAHSLGGLPVDGVFQPFDKLLTPGTQLLHANDQTVFRIGPVGANDALQADNNRTTVIHLPAQRYKTMVILGAASPTGVEDASFLISYANRDESHPQGISPTTYKHHFPGESVLIEQDERTFPDAPYDNEYKCLYTYRLKLDPDQPLKSLTLPQDNRILIFAITLLPY